MTTQITTPQTDSTQSTPTGTPRRSNGTRVALGVLAGVVGTAGIGGGVLWGISSSDGASAASPSTPSHRVVPNGGGGSSVDSGVAHLQEELRTLNYYDGPLTGQMGPRTTQALEDFQAWAATRGFAQPVHVTGTLDSATRAALEYTLAHGSSTMNRGTVPSSSPAVVRLQKDLATLNYYDGPVTGQMGPRTTKALTAFQSWASSKPFGHDVAATGRLDTATRNAISYALGNGDSTMNDGVSGSTMNR